MNYIHTDENAIYYECGYSCDNAIYLSLGNEAFFITDARYTIDATLNVKKAKVIEASDLVKEVIEIVGKTDITSIKFNPKEWDYNSIKKLQEGLLIDFKEEIDLSHKKRIIKTDDEIRLLKKAVKLGKLGFKRFANELYHHGKKSTEESLAFVNYTVMSDYGKYDTSFDAIVAINENAAKPHATPSRKKLKKNDLILVDAGIKYKRYCSDRTRTASFYDSFSFSLSQKFKSQKIQKAYDIVLKAHDKAISKVRSGMSAREVDAIAREVIDKSQFSGLFVHSTGHGVGLDIHEHPYINKRNETILEDNMVFTIEPGIYLEKHFGIRIEDMVVLKNGRAEIL